MRLTIVRSDNLVIIDTFPIRFDLSGYKFPEKFHALQWFEDKGEVEFTDCSPNESITSIDFYQPVIDEYNRLQHDMDNQPEPTPEESYQQMIAQRDRMLAESDWTVIRHKDEEDMRVDTTLTDEAYRSTLLWRQQLRDIPENMAQPMAVSTLSLDVSADPPLSDTTGNGWIWPPIPDAIADDFPDYPPDL